MRAKTVALDDMDLNVVIEQVKQFNHERDWDQFHNPKDLILALMSEVGELAECYRWISKEELGRVMADPAKKKKIEEELADIAMYLIMLSYKTDIDLSTAIQNKLEKNKLRFPIEKVKGVHTNPLEGYKPSTL